jgi:PAS domain S-box-containing protein
MGEAIRFRRKELAKSQEDFAYDTNLGRGHVNELEHGRRAMSLRTLLKVARGLDILPSVLFRRAEQSLGIFDESEKQFAPVDEQTLIDHDLSFLKCLVNFSSMGLVVTDPNHPDNAIIFASQPFLNMTQYTRDEVTGKNCRFLQGAERDQPEVEKLRKAMFNAEPVVVQLRNFRKDGTLFQNQLSMSPIFDNRKNLINFIGVQCVI